MSFWVLKVVVVVVSLFFKIHYLILSVSVLTTPENTITYYNTLSLSPQNFA